MKNKIVILTLLVVLSSAVFASFSQSLNFSSSVETTCGVVFKSRGSIAFKDEEPKLVGDFEIVSNIDKRKDVILKIKKLKKSKNLQDLTNSNIYIIIDKYRRINVREMLTKGVKIKSKNHKMYIYIDKDRNSIVSGRSRVSFEMEVICGK